MGAPLKTIKALRITAKVLLAATPLMVLSGFLTAKPHLLSSLDFATSRLIHTVVAPLVFIPLLVAHSTAGVLYILNRSKRITSPKARFALAAAWAAFLVGLSLLYFIDQPTIEPVDDWAEEQELVAPSSDAAPISEDPDAQNIDGGSDTGDPDAQIIDRGTGSEPGGDPEESVDGGASTPQKGPRKRATKTRPRSQKNTIRTTPVQSQDASLESSLSESRPLSGSKLLRKRCGSCHPMSTVYGEKRSASEWRSVVGRMISMGAKLDPTERQAVLRHLVGSYGL